MQRVIALVGRPNVGKSTLFNRLTRTRNALVSDFPGLTRDRQYGIGRVGERPYIVVDTGGLSGDTDGVEVFMQQQVQLALEEASAVFFLVDGRDGLVPHDQVIAEKVRALNKPVFLLVNKAEGLSHATVSADFYALGLGEPIAISSAHGENVTSLMDDVLDSLGVSDEEEASLKTLAPGIRIAVVGRPNVGKSTLMNRMVGEERVIAFDMPGTTRDSIFVPFERDDQQYTLIDTAGIRRRARVNDMIEKFSVIKAIQAMESAHVVIVMLDGSEGITDQDLHLVGMALDSGRGLVLAVNKWDGLSKDQREDIKRQIDLRLSFVSYAEHHFISALHGTGVGLLLGMVKQVYTAATRTLPTPALTRVLQESLLVHQPPLVRGRRVKMRYAHTGGHNPPIIVVHGNQLDDMPAAYTRFLEQRFRKAFDLFGTPVRIEYKTSENPFADKKNELSDRQIKRKKRLISFAKHSDKQKKRKNR
jgi:GTP-binding protein